MSNSITTISGVEFDLLNPTPDMINIVDIDHALNRICRFGGHYTGPHYSVASHSVGVASLVDDPELRLAALLHDAAEAYIGDIVTPLKGLLNEIHGIERKILECVAIKFDFDPMKFRSLEIKKADLQMLYAERKYIVPHNSHYWACFDILEGDYRLERATIFLQHRRKTLFMENFNAYTHRRTSSPADIAGR